MSCLCVVGDKAGQTSVEEGGGKRGGLVVCGSGKATRKKHTRLKQKRAGLRWWRREAVVRRVFFTDEWCTTCNGLLLSRPVVAPSLSPPSKTLVFTSLTTSASIGPAARGNTTTFHMARQRRQRQRRIKRREMANQAERVGGWVGGYTYTLKAKEKARKKLKGTKCFLTGNLFSL